MSLWRLTSNVQHHPSLFKLTHLLQVCSDSKYLKQGQQIHQHVIVSGSGDNTYIVTKVIQLYADCDDLGSARKLFDVFPHPNMFAWTSILGFFSRHGMYEECVENYGLMKFRGVPVDNYVFPKVLKACAQLSWLDGGRWVHGSVVLSGCDWNLQVCNALIDVYAKCGDVSSGRLVFEEMGTTRDLLSWNSLISGYVSNGLLELAVQHFATLRLHGIEPDIITLNMAMDAYSRMGLCDKASKVFEQLSNPNIISWTTLMSGYSKAGNYDTCLRTFNDMVNEGTVVPDVDSLSLVLVSCRHLCALMHGKAIHCYGIKTGSVGRFYRSAGPALLIMYAKCDSIQYAKTVFAVMDKSDIVAWNAMILAFAELDLKDLALECFIEMQKIGIRNDQTTISTVLPLCDLKHGKQIHGYIMKCIVDKNVIVSNAVIHMYCSCGKIGTAYSVFSNLKTRDLVTWNTMIRGFGMHGHGQAALKLLQEMDRLGISPDSVTFTSVLSGCDHSGLVEEGFKLFESMTREYGFIPRMEHYSCVVNMLARAGKLEAATSFIDQMPLQPDKSIWGVLLAACLEQQNVDVGKLAAEQLVHLEPRCSGHYVTLSNLYAEAGNWSNAIRVRKEMEARGLVKTSGHSWII